MRIRMEPSVWAGELGGHLAHTNSYGIHLNQDVVTRAGLDQNWRKQYLEITNCLVFLGRPTEIHSW